MENKIKQMYDEMYKSQIGNMEKAKNDALAGVNKNEETMKNDVYQQQNQAAYNNARNKRKIRDHMANSNLVASGENLDAMGRQNTDYSNTVGALNSYYNKRIGEYGDERNKINNNYTSDLNSLKADIEAKKIKDLLAYQMQQQQMAAARSYSGGGGGYSSGGSGKYTETQAKADLDNEIGYALGTGDPSTIATARDRLNAAYQQGLITDSYYNGKLSGLNASYTSSSKANDKIAQGNYGYSQTPRPNAKPYRPGKNTVQRW